MKYTLDVDKETLTRLANEDVTEEELESLTSELMHKPVMTVTLAEVLFTRAALSVALSIPLDPSKVPGVIPGVAAKILWGYFDTLEQVQDFLGNYHLENVDWDALLEFKNRDSEEQPKLFAEA